MSAPPVITIDGPAAAGKGTIARALAAQLNFHYLDSGRLYRAVGLAAHRAGQNPADADAMLAVAERLSADADALQALLADAAITDDTTAQAASTLSALPAVRRALVALQLAARRPPGLVADGRDMGSVIFPAADFKVYLFADLRVRAERRFAQLREKGIHAIMSDIRDDIQRRDQRDQTRATAPLVRLDEAWQMDTTRLSADDAVQRLLRRLSDIGIYPSHPTSD